MTDFEDELRATMRAHDGEAPPADALRAPDASGTAPHAASGGRYTWLPIAAAAAAVATLVGITFALGGGENRGAPTLGASAPSTRSAAASSPATTSSSPAATGLRCPGRYVPGHPAPWVPAPPSGIDGTTRLAPDRTPTSVVVCAYLHGDSGALTGHRPLTGDLAAVTATLAWPPRDDPAVQRACATYATLTDQDNYLVGLTYGSATEWVSAPGQHCEGSSNGAFRSSQNLRPVLDASYRAGRWVDRSTAATPGCTQTGDGRLGQDAAVVPPGATALTVCTDGRTARPLPVSDVAAVAAALDALPPADPATVPRCPGGPTVYLLRFGYRTGPPVWVRVMPGCTPGVDNGSRQATLTTAVRSTITGLVGH